MQMMTNRKRGAFYAARQAFIETIARQFLEPMRDFESIKYCHFYSTDEEFVRISDTFGSTCFLDITALSTPEVIKEICKLVVQDHDDRIPASLVWDKEKIRHIAPLFR